MKILSSIFGVMFLAFTFVQFNDPDPILWIAIYGVMTVVSIMAFFNKYFKILIIGLGLAYLVYAILLFPSAITWIQSADRSLLFDNIAKMQYPYIEETREFLGLMICMAVLIFYFLYHLKNTGKVQS
ncbi:MAG: transmembrane 220 family protein [Cyclobacteriaceae bacterium]